ncbi:DNA polymerase IV [Eudoraea chungangensis]|uniref:DNA polymerase IV n=1 Tax=Eudoraea chungangensis TaxID=1481905 RepID=UPI0023ED9D19|nr:DNA polymerase IV [Eudoraea chungangensis]
MQLQGPFRKIIHVDMDAFYASVEQLDSPELQGKPIAVGGNEIRGVVSAASYEARKYGVKSAMSGVLARKYCPNLIFVKPRYNRYKEVSKAIRDIFHKFTDLVEPLSLDEAYLDVTENKKGNPSATLLAEEIRKQIYAKTNLTASAGISINKFIAKVASDYNKPNGQKTVTPEEALSFLEGLDIRKFYGIGKVTTQKMYALGIFTGKDLKAQSLEFLEAHFGKSGSFYYKVVRGIHNSPVKSKRPPKSVGAERTFETNLSSEIFMVDKLQKIANELDSRLKKSVIAGRTLTLKIKYSDFSTQSRSKTLPFYISDKSMILETAKELLLQDQLENSVRLLGISLSNLNTQNQNKNTMEDEKVSVQLRIDF